MELKFGDVATEAGLADRPYLKPFLEKEVNKESVAEVLKKLDGAESLIGKSFRLPTDEDPKSWDDFAGKLRPAKPEEYEINLGEKPDEEFIAATRAAAHAAGLSKAQLKRFVDSLTPTFKAKDEAAAAAFAKQEQEFKSMIASITGGSDFASKQARVVDVVKATVPESVRKSLDKMDPASLALMTAVVSSVLDKYGKEDNPSGRGRAGHQGGRSVSDIRKDLAAVQESPGWKIAGHADRSSAVARFNELIQELSEAQGG